MKSMKRKIIMIISLLILGIMPILAQTLQVYETSVSNNDELEIKITCKGINNYIATGFCIELPDGFSVNGVEGHTTNNLLSDHVIKVGQIDNNKIRVAIYSLSNSPFNISETAGDSNSPLNLCNIKLGFSPLGSFKGQLSNIEFATSSYSLVTAETNAFDITIQMLGDVNDDGTVDISDYIGVANHILGNTPEGFNEAAADVNNDGSIDISDYIGVANIILTGKP